MKKTLIALTLASLPVAAMAEVVLYGQIKAGYEASTTKESTKGAKRTPYQNGIADFGSRIGFKGQEDLGNGLKAIWQVENKISVAGAGSWASRDSFIGLEGGFGKVRAGNLSNYSNSNMSDVDAWEYSNAALGLGKFTRTDTRRAAVRYDTPNFAGFSGAVMYTPRDNASSSTDSRWTARGNETHEVYGAGLSYENAGFFGKYGFEYAKNTVNSFNGQVHRLEGGYDANNVFVALGYQNARNVATYADYAVASAGGNPEAALPVRGQEVALTGGYHFGNVFPKISYAHGWNVKETFGKKETVKNTSYDQIVIGADYDFSKRTTANVQVGWLREGLGEVKKDGKDKTRTTALGVGLKHKF